MARTIRCSAWWSRGKANARPRKVAIMPCGHAPYTGESPCKTFVKPQPACTAGVSGLRWAPARPMMRAMRWPFFNHIRLLLRYAGFFTYLSAGTPLVTTWAAERLNQLQRPSFSLLLWTLCYLVFGLMYWL